MIARSEAIVKDVFWFNIMAFYFLDDTAWSNGDVEGRCFYQFSFCLYPPSTEKHASLIDELKGCRAQEDGDTWVLSFLYSGYDFFVDCHGHSTTTSFIVAQPDCPDEILLQILGIFTDPMRIAANHEPSHAEVLKTPSSGNSRNMFVRWGIRALAFGLAIFAIYSLAHEDYSHSVGSIAGAVFLVVVSFCSDYAASKTY